MIVWGRAVGKRTGNLWDLVVSEWNLSGNLIYLKNAGWVNPISLSCISVFQSSTQKFPQQVRTWDIEASALGATSSCKSRLFVLPHYLFCLSLQVIMSQVVHMAEGNGSLYFKYCCSSYILAQTHIHGWFGLRCQWVNWGSSIRGTCSLLSACLWEHLPLPKV